MAQMATTLDIEGSERKITLLAGAARVYET